VHYNFGLDFQEHILASVIGDGDFLKANLDVFHAEYFNDDILGGIASAVLDFYRREKEVPSKEAILHDLKDQIAPGRKFHEYSDTLETIFEKIGVNAAYYQGKAVEFAKTQAVANALKESTVYLESGEIQEVGRSIANALKIGNGFNQSRVYDYFGSARKRAKDYRLNGASKGRLATGFYPLDEAISGGLGKGEIGLIVAPPKHGKTTMLINIATGALMQGKGVAYVTLELSQKMIASKFDTRLFGREISSIKKKPKSFVRALAELREKMTGKLHIIEYPTKGLSVDKLESVIEGLDACDLVVVDYGQLLKSGISRGERRHEITDIYENLRRVAGELKIPIWTAHQGNRPSTGSKIVGMEHVAEDFNIVAIADLAVSINQSEEERRQNKLRLYVMGSRIGASGQQIDCDVNWRTANIRPSIDESKEALE